MKKRIFIVILLSFLCSCSKGDNYESKNENIDNKITPSPVLEEIKIPQSPLEKVQECEAVLIDYSNTSSGYIRAKGKNEQIHNIKLRISCGEEYYDYDINKSDDFETYPLNMGNGTYTVMVCEKIEGTRYAVIAQFDMEVNLENELYPFLYPNQVVDYSPSTQAVQISFDLVKDDKTQLDRVHHIYQYVIQTLDYDWKKADEVTNAYVLPVLDDVIEKKKGICFDYSALMCAMLRVQDIPTKVITGYVDEGYHAWVEVYIDNIGWIAPHLYFESNTWTRVDPTFDSIDKGYKGEYTNKYMY